MSNEYYFESNTPASGKRYFTVSMLLHGALAAALFAVSAAQIEKNKSFNIEYISDSTQLAAAPSTAPTRTPTPTPAPAAAPTPTEPSTSTSTSTSAATVAPTQAKAKPSVTKTAQLNNSISPAQSLSDSEFNTDLDDESLTTAAKQHGENVNSEKLNSDLDSEFKKVDSNSNSSLKLAQQDLESEASAVEGEHESNLKALESKAAAEAKAMNQNRDAVKAKNAAALAAALETERAAAAKAEADAIAAAKAKEAAAAQAAARAAQQNASQYTGEGVRSVGQLRQMPGNPLPAYSVSERVRQQQGLVTYHAFVTEDGRLTQFKKIKSTGFENLDNKTLAALKKWRFYPGQPGWVEIPQNWSITGDAEEMPAQLRRDANLDAGLGENTGFAEETPYN